MVLNMETMVFQKTDSYFAQMRSIITIIFVSLFCNILKADDNFQAQKSPIKSRQIKLLSTTNIIADTVRNIVGDVVKVVASAEKAADNNASGNRELPLTYEFSIKSLMNPGVDPHLYKATQGDLKKINDSDLIFFNGIHLEGKMTDILERLSKKKRIINVSDAVSQDKLRAIKGFEGTFDPHIWFDIELWSQVVKLIERELADEFPEFTNTFKDNAAKYLIKLSDLHTYCKTKIASIPKQQRVLITAHDAFEYFGRAYDIEVHGLQGVSTATEYGLSDVTRIVNLIIERKVKAIFVESSVPERFLNAVVEGVQAKGGSVKKGGVLFSDSLGSPETEGGTYIGMLRSNVDTITEGLLS
jgi:manganese/zinc/iron transport system substrate-binding protein